MRQGILREELFRLPGCVSNHPDQGMVYAARRGAGIGQPVLLALHGSGRQAESYRDIPFYRFQRDRALDNGYLFLCISNGMDTWGLDDGLRNVEALHAFILAREPVRPDWVLWATSAGGALMHRLVRERGAMVRGSLATFPVYDLLDAFAHSPGCGKAWGASSAAELGAVLHGRNPPDFVADLTGREYLIFHGREDTLLAPERHSLRFRDEANARGGRVEVVLTAGGHSTGNGAVCDREAVDRRLRAWARG